MKGDYYRTIESVDEYIKLAKDANGILLIEKLKKILPHKSDLLEIGSGPGTDWRILNKQYNVIGSDNSSEFLNHLKSKNPKGEFLELDAVNLLTNKKFDGIYSNKVLHHLTDKDLLESIKRQFEILNTNGIICHSFWKGEGSEYFKGLFVNYHDKLHLKNLIQEYFNVISIENYEEFENDDSLILLGRKK